MPKSLPQMLLVAVVVTTAPLLAKAGTSVLVQAGIAVWVTVKMYVLVTVVVIYVLMEDGTSAAVNVGTLVP